MNKIIGTDAVPLPSELEPLWACLRAPATHEPLGLIPRVVSGGYVRDADIFTLATHKHVGVLRHFQFDFHTPSQLSTYSPHKIPAGAATIDVQPAILEIDHRAPQIVYSGSWQDDGGNHFADGHSDSGLAIRIATSGVRLRVLCFPWGGRAQVTIDGRDVACIDTYEAYETSVREFCVAEGLPFCEHDIALWVLGDKAAESKASQIRIAALLVETAELVPIRFSRAPGSAANPFPERFHELRANCPAEGRILDCGGGKRQVSDPRYFNFEYEPGPYPNVFGDAHQLPFADHSFDLILSQAVMEHMRQPFVAAQELIRVCKPGGLVYVESAFMQPAHCRPIHFFNTTIWGLQELFRDVQILDSGNFGGFADLTRWIASYVAAMSGMESERAALIALAHNLDAASTVEERANFASGVFLLATKSG